MILNATDSPTLGYVNVASQAVSDVHRAAHCTQGVMPVKRALLVIGRPLNDGECSAMESEEIALHRA
jgi:hypothetical protein